MQDSASEVCLCEDVRKGGGMIDVTAVAKQSVWGGNGGAVDTAKGAKQARRAKNVLLRERLYLFSVYKVQAFVTAKWPTRKNESLRPAMDHILAV